MKLARERSAANLQAAFEAEGIGNMKVQARTFNAPILDPTYSHFVSGFVPGRVG